MKSTLTLPIVVSLVARQRAQPRAALRTRVPRARFLARPARRRGALTVHSRRLASTRARIDSRRRALTPHRVALDARCADARRARSATSSRVDARTRRRACTPSAARRGRSCAWRRYRCRTNWARTTCACASSPRR